jgi:hypothetical protein
MSWVKTNCMGILGRAEPDPFPEFCRYLRSLHPPDIRIAIVCDNSAPPDRQEGQARRAVGRGQQRRDRLHPDNSS